VLDTGGGRLLLRDDDDIAWVVAGRFIPEMTKIIIALGRLKGNNYVLNQC